MHHLVKSDVFIADAADVQQLFTCELIAALTRAYVCKTLIRLEDRINFFPPGEIPPDLNQMTKLQALFFTQKGSQAALEAHARCRWGPRPGRGLRQRRRGPQSSASWGRFPHWPQSGVLYSVCCRGSVPISFL